MKKSKKTESDEHIHIRLPAEEKAALIAAAERFGFNFTTWVRLTLRQAAGLDKR